jgi:hypothetical protein
VRRGVGTSRDRFGARPVARWRARQVARQPARCPYRPKPRDPAPLAALGRHPGADIYAARQHRHARSESFLAGSPVTIALCASTIASPPARQRLCLDRLRPPRLGRSGVRVDVRSGGHPEGRPAGHPASLPESGFVASQRRPPRSGRADIPASQTDRATCLACPAGSAVPIALGATAIPSAPVTQRSSASAATIALGATTIAFAPAAQRPRPRGAAASAPWAARLAQGTSSRAPRTVQVDAGRHDMRAASDRGRRPIGGPLRPFAALFYMDGRSGSGTDGGAGAPRGPASMASKRLIVAPASRPASPGCAGAPAARVPSPVARVQGARSGAIWRLWMPSQEQPTAKARCRT